MIRKGDHITQVGRMKFELTLQSRVSTADGMGGFTVSWADTATIKADIMPLSMIERTQGERLIAESTHKLIARFRDITPTTQRLLYGTRVWNINSVVNPDNANSHIVIYVREE